MIKESNPNENNFELPFSHTVSEDADDMTCDIFTPEEFDEWLEELANEN